MDAMRLLLACTLIGLAGCAWIPTGGPDCTNEMRSIDAQATFPDGGHVIVGLHEERNARSKRTAEQKLLWGGVLGFPRDSVTVGHVHEGPPGAPGRLLLTLDPRSVASHLPPRTLATEQADYAGLVSFSMVFQLMRDGRTHLDLHVGPDTLRAPLVPLNPAAAEWFHPYCS